MHDNNKKIVSQPDDDEIIAWLDGDFILCLKCYDKKPEVQKMCVSLHDFSTKGDTRLEEIKQGDIIYCDVCGERIQWVNYKVANPDE